MDELVFDCVREGALDVEEEGYGYLAGSPGIFDLVD